MAWLQAGRSVVIDVIGPRDDFLPKAVDHHARVSVDRPWGKRVMRMRGRFRVWCCMLRHLPGHEMRSLALDILCCDRVSVDTGQEARRWSWTDRPWYTVVESAPSSETRMIGERGEKLSLG
jgi:hypothetical protein